MAAISRNDPFDIFLCFFCIVNPICFKEQFYEANGINDVSKKTLYFSVSNRSESVPAASQLDSPGEARCQDVYAELKEVRTVRCSINHSERVYQEKTNPHYEWTSLHS